LRSHIAKRKQAVFILEIIPVKTDPLGHNLPETIPQRGDGKWIAGNGGRLNNAIL
jgi:hypothetical protein